MPFVDGYNSMANDVEETTALLGHPPTEPSRPNDEKWEKPKNFALIEIVILCNVFLAGFDGTVTASTYAVISSDFMSSKLASWITTSYLLTSTAVQPLYGRFSDAFGRRACLLSATMIFGIGCFGCSVSKSLIFLNIMRAVTGCGGGGLMTMATIVNSDLVPSKQRGMYQAAQNILHGFGAIVGASLGGTISDAIGWRFCFFLQVPVSLAVLAIAGRTFKVDSPALAVDVLPSDEQSGKRLGWKEIDLTGAALLFTGLILQLSAMSLGSNDLPWSHPTVIGTLCASIITLALFIFHERRTEITPILPLELLGGRERLCLLFSNISLGVAAYGGLFLMPLLFQAVLLDSATVAGLRLVPPALATPLGGLTAGIAMRYTENISLLTIGGLLIFFIGTCITLSLGMHDPEWKYYVYPIVGNFGQGIAYPSILFGFIGACEKRDHAVATSLVYLTRSTGTVWAIAATSAIVQSIISRKLHGAMAGVPGADEAVEKLSRSISVLKHLSPELRLIAQRVYCEACRMGLAFLAATTLFALICSVVGRKTRR